MIKFENLKVQQNSNRIMPFKSDRATLINELEQLLRLMIADDADNTSEFEEIMDIYVTVTGSRYLNERSYVPKSIEHWLILSCNSLIENLK